LIEGGVGWQRGGEEERKGERVRLTSGAQVSASIEKKKKGRLGGPLAGELGGPAGLARLKGER
jgi:hypothetical protein